MWSFPAPTTEGCKSTARFLGRRLLIFLVMTVLLHRWRSDGRVAETSLFRARGTAQCESGTRSPVDGQDLLFMTVTWLVLWQLGVRSTVILSFSVHGMAR